MPTMTMLNENNLNSDSMEAGREDPDESFFRDQPSDEDEQPRLFDEPDDSQDDAEDSTSTREPTPTDDDNDAIPHKFLKE